MSGALVSRVGGATFERGLAAVVSVSAANAVALVGLGAVGGVVLVATAAVGDALTVAVGVGLVLTVAVGAAAVGAWRRRRWVAARVGGAVGALCRRVGRRVPRVDPPGPAAVVERAESFVASLERVADDPRRLVAVVALGVAGHLAVAATLWTALAALDAPVAPARVLVVVPVARLAGASPTPGGTASAEALLTGLLVGVGVAAPVAAAAALVYRAAAFWIPTLGGGAVTVWLLVTSD